MEIQESLLEAMGKKDEGLETALKSTAESSALLNKNIINGYECLISFNATATAATTVAISLDTAPTTFF